MRALKRNLVTLFILLTAAVVGAPTTPYTPIKNLLATTGISGSSAANGDLDISGTTNATKATSDVTIQTAGGNTAIGGGIAGSAFTANNETYAFTIPTFGPAIDLSLATQKFGDTLNHTEIVVSSGSIALKIANSTMLTLDSNGATAPTIYGSSAANGDLAIHGTSNATRATSDVNIQTTAGDVSVGYDGFKYTNSNTTATLGDYALHGNGTTIQVADGTRVITLGGLTTQINTTNIQVGGNNDPLTPVRAKKKNSTDSRTSNTTVTADSELVIPIAASQVWNFEFHVFVGSSSTTPGWKGGLTFPSSPTDVRWTMDYHDYDALTITPKGLFTGDSTTTTCTFGGTSSGGEVIMRGQIRNGANAGNITLMYAQAVSNASSTLNKTRSYATATLVP